MHFSPRVETPSLMNINYISYVIQQLDNTKFLGLIIDKKLNWKAHVESVCKEISRSSFASYKLSTHTLHTLLF